MKRAGIVRPLILMSLLLPIVRLHADTPPQPPPVHVPRLTAPITIDGNLDDPGWKGAAKIDKFFEISPGDDIPAKVRTVAWITYDDKYFYIGLEADDPNPSKIRAPYVDRDQVIGTDDNIAIWLDTRNDTKATYELRVSPRGIQGDAIFNDATGSEDFSPDFFYDTAAKITDHGWQAEMRIPFSSLRYPEVPEQSWGIIIWRNYPRDFRYAFYNVPSPRGSNCVICRAQKLTGLENLPHSNHLVMAPYATAQQSETRATPTDSWQSGSFDSNFGGDVKWNPTPSSTLDATINPDFSQIEADVPQISTNERFALFYPEKRPFFLEGIDLFETPIQAVYTRSITSPRWGVRGTGQTGDTNYTVLVTQDRGGGLVIMPGPFGSDFAPQEFSSISSIARVRHDIGSSFVGLLVTDREIDGGGHNRVVGPDFQWRPTKSDIVAGQVLFSSTENPDRTDLYPTWTGQSLSSYAANLSWSHDTRRYSTYLMYNDYGDDFRADLGFVPQTGYREGYAMAAWRSYPEGLFRMVQWYTRADVILDRDGATIERHVFPGVFFLGRHNLTGQFNLYVGDQIQAGGKLLEQNYLAYFLQIDPSRRLSRIGINGRVGEAIDFANARVGDGTTIAFTTTVRPTDHLQLDADTTWQWLDIHDGNLRGRLFTAQVEHLKATYTFSARSLLRLIGQYSETTRDPNLYLFDVPKRNGSFLGSLLYSYKLNWQTVLFLGYGDDRVLTENGDLFGTNRTAFFKVSYAIQR